VADPILDAIGNTSGPAEAMPVLEEAKCPSPGAVLSGRLCPRQQAHDALLVGDDVDLRVVDGPLVREAAEMLDQHRERAQLVAQFDVPDHAIMVIFNLAHGLGETVRQGSDVLEAPVRFVKIRDIGRSDADVGILERLSLTACCSRCLSERPSPFSQGTSLFRLFRGSAHDKNENG
jgi:hypothetical protein